MRILIDLDGVVYRYVDAFKACVSERRRQPIEELGDAESWNFYRQPGWNMTTPEFLEHMRHAIRHQDLFLRGSAYPGSWRALRDLWPHELIVVSSRKYGLDTERCAWEQTLEWLDRNHFPYFEEIVITDSSQSKADICKEFELTVAIEDSLDNHNALLDAGVQSFLISRPWNAGGIVDVPNRVESMAQFAEAVQDLAHA